MIAYQSEHSFPYKPTGNISWNKCMTMNYQYKNIKPSRIAEAVMLLTSICHMFGSSLGQDKV
jgi:hypothetical protein